MNTPIELGQALRQLPLEAPEHSQWPALQAHLPKRRAWPKWPMALAAGMALALIVPQFNGTATRSAGAGLQTAAAPDAAGLMARSAALENAYYAAQDDGISSATVIAANLEIEAQLAAIDARLAAQPAAADERTLWQQRIALLDQGLTLNRTNADYNAEGRNYDLALAGTN